jgi:purine-nucleoside phosphorylase
LTAASAPDYRAAMTTPQAPDLPSLLHIPSPLPSPSAHPSLAGLPLSHTQALISIRSRLPKELRSPRLGIVCGSGLQGLAEKLVERVEVNYVDIEGMPDSTGPSSPSCPL